MLTAVPLMVVGDCAAQRLEGRHAFDTSRTATMALYSGAIYTPWVLQVYRLQERLLAGSGSPVFAAAQKSVFSVIVGGAPANAAFVSLATMLETMVWKKKPVDRYANASLPELLKMKLREDWPRIMRGSFCFWVPMNFINFYFVPLHFRLMVTSVASTAWNCFLSLIQHEYMSECEPVTVNHCTLGQNIKRCSG